MFLILMKGNWVSLYSYEIIKIVRDFGQTNNSTHDQYWVSTCSVIVLHEQIKGICKSKGGLRMELTPIRLHTRPSSVATFTCSYRAHVPLNITFHMLGLSNPAKVMERVGRGRREEEVVEEEFLWSGSRRWRVEVGSGQAVVVCSLVTPTTNRTVGRLHALLTTDVEHTAECSAVGECDAGGNTD